jgi:hypothetical protein
VRSLTGAASEEAGVKFGLGEEGVVVGLLVLHGFDVSAQGFIGLSDGELFDSRFGAIRIADTDGVTKFAAM